MPTVQSEPLRALVTAIFQAAGASEENAGIVASSLVLSDLVGHEAHGVVRVPQYLRSIAAGDIQPAAAPVVARETAVMVAVDACRTFGQVAARFAIERAVAKAKTQGLAVAGVFHCNHVGRLGEWVTLAAEAGTVGLAFCSLGQRGAAVAPFGGSARLLGTNPLAAAVPLEGRAPMIVDFATSAVAEGKLRVARNRGKSIPEGWIVAGDGRATSDPNDFYTGGALLPMAGHKGYGLGLLVEMLGGLLTDAGTEPESAAEGHGTLFIALDPGLFRPACAFMKDAAALAERAANSPPAAGFAQVLVPGDPEHRSAAARKADGIPLDDTCWGQLVESAAAVGVSTESLHVTER